LNTINTADKAGVSQVSYFHNSLKSIGVLKLFRVVVIEDVQSDQARGGDGFYWVLHKLLQHYFHLDNEKSEKWDGQKKEK
jgi:hypothetical protein